MEWLNEPAQWRHEGDDLLVTPDAGSDFWRLTEYGFIHDNGHALLEPVGGDFIATVSVTADYRAQFDQAGLLIRIDERNWLKTGIEHVDGRCFLSAVVTRDYSDWSVAPLDACPDRLWLRVTRKGETVEIAASLDGATFQMLRIAHLPSDAAWKIGPMACAPIASGFTAHFADFSTDPA
jgi:regulation of enolase protein 1 (concanavalin A-like superfamily)